MDGSQPKETSGRPKDLAEAVSPGVLGLKPGGDLGFADPRAIELLGCSDGFELERLWSELRPRLESAGLSWDGAGGEVRTADLDLAVQKENVPQTLTFDLRRDPAGGGILLVQETGFLEGMETDLRLTSQMRSLSQISPAVAHDLRAPINAMVFNIEILKEMIASGRATDPNNRDKLLRYTSVLKEELSRLHKGLENFLGYISPRSDKTEVLDLRELTEELAALLVAPARKQQVQVTAEVPEETVPVEGNRYLLRQALLHLSLAALAGVPRQGTLKVRLEPLDGRARILLHGEAGTDSPPAAEAAPSPGFDLHFSAGGSQARLWVARAILEAHGGEVRPTAGSTGDATVGGGDAYEVELTTLVNPSSRYKE